MRYSQSVIIASFTHDRISATQNITIDARIQDSDASLTTITGPFEGAHDESRNVVIPQSPSTEYEPRTKY
jgi:hypothetical protein